MMHAVDIQEIDLFQYSRILYKRKKFFFGFVFIAVLLMFVRLYKAPNFYKAQAVVWVDSSNDGGVFATLVQNVGVSALGTSQSAIQKVEAMLRTRELAKQVIRANDLLPVFFAGNLSELKSPNNDTQEMAMQMGEGELLENFVNFERDKKNNTLVISAEFENPELASKVVNSYLEQLQIFINKNSMTQAKRQRLNIEKQIEENKQGFLRASAELQNFSSANKKDRRLYLSFTDRHDVILNESVSNGVNDIKKQELVLDNEISRFNFADIPDSVYLKYLVSQMELMNRLHFLLVQQYEVAKIQESKEQLDFQVIDPTTVPQFSSRPKRKQMLMVTFAASSFFAIFLIFLMEYLQKIRKDF